VQGVVDVAQEHRFGLAGVASLQEPLVGDAGQCDEGFGPAESVVPGFEVETALVPALGLVQVTQGGYGQVGVAQGAGEHDFHG
jgi:hypothetical protein